MGDFLWNLSSDTKYLTREIDAKYFPENFEKIHFFQSYETSFKEYILEKEDRDENEKRVYEHLLEEHPEIKDTKIIINGENYFNSGWYPYPIHYLFLLDNEWRYVQENSVKWPSMAEILSEAFFEPDIFDSEQDCWKISGAEKIFVLVLNCDELCDVKEYWNHVAFVAKYEKGDNRIEICDLNKGILEFHNLLQKSKDLR